MIVFVGIVACDSDLRLLLHDALGAAEADLCGNIFGQQGRQLGQQMAVLREAILDWNVAGEIRKVPLGISEI